MSKKLLSLCLAICCFFYCNQASAWEFDKKAIMKDFNCKSVDTPKYALDNVIQSIIKENCTFENDIVKIETSPGIHFDNVIFGSGFRKAFAKSKIFILTTNTSIMGDNISILVAPFVQFDITNKTDEPIELDLNHSQISLGSYQGMGIQQGSKYNGSIPSVQPPVIIPPKAIRTVTLWRKDHQFFSETTFYGDILVPGKWLPPFDVIANTNLLGEMALNIDKKHIIFTPNVSIQFSKLKWIKGKQGN